MQHLFGPPNEVEKSDLAFVHILYATVPFLLTLICVDVAEKVGMTTKEILRATATTLFQYHSRGNTAIH